MYTRTAIENEVSETALITIRSRVAEYRKDDPVILDPVGEDLLNELLTTLDGGFHKSILNRRLSPTLSRYIALRARKYDQYVRDFLQRYPKGLIVSLGSGFDTRFWRCSLNRHNYIEVDLPEVICLKSQLLGKQLDFEVIPMSVLDNKLWDILKSRGTSEVLFIAEGLLMYLPADGVERIFRSIADNFNSSEFIFEVVNERYTRGMWKKMVERKIRNSAGSEAGTSYQFGIKDKSDIEKLSDKFKVSEEWSYFEDPDIKPSVLFYFRNIRLFSRTQWTLKLSIGQHD